jgi:hypothetical protein
MKGSGYRNVRHNAEGKDDPSGNIVQLLNGDSIEQVALEIPWPIYEDHLEAMSEKSRRMYSSSKASVQDHVSERYGLNVFDEEDDEQREYMDWMISKAQRGV